VDAFRKEARQDLGYSQLLNQPKKYRGEVVLVKGRLRRIEKFDAPLALQLEGVPFIYEGWLFANGYSSTPVCILFTELPPGVELGDRKNLDASFAGYYFKKYRYTADDPQGKPQRRFAPLLIGRMPEIQKAPAASETGNDLDKQLLWVTLSVVGGTVIAVLAITLWFRFHDMRVRQKVDQAIRREFVLPAPDSDEKFRAGQVTPTASETTENWSGVSETQPGEPELKMGTHNRLPEYPPS